MQIVALSAEGKDGSAEMRRDPETHHATNRCDGADGEIEIVDDFATGHVRKPQAALVQHDDESTLALQDEIGDRLVEAEDEQRQDETCDF
jgi:hypothetical protein